jgi:hypothetical protein
MNWRIIAWAVHGPRFHDWAYTNVCALCEARRPNTVGAAASLCPGPASWDPRWGP